MAKDRIVEYYKSDERCIAGSDTQSVCAFAYSRSSAYLHRVPDKEEKISKIKDLYRCGYDLIGTQKYMAIVFSVP